MFFAFVYIPDRYKTQQMCQNIVSEDPFMSVYCLDKYKAQGTCDQAVDDSIVALKLISDWSDWSVVKHDNTFLANNTIVFCNEDLIKSVIAN